MKPPQSGFTVLELLVTVVIMAILAALAGPSLKEMYESNRLATQANEVVASVALARTEALRRNARVIMCRFDAVETTSTPASGSCTAGADAWKGWIVFADLDGSGTFSTVNDQLLQVVNVDSTKIRLLSSGFLSTNTNRFDFRGDGMPRDATGLRGAAGTLRACISGANAAQNARDVMVGISGSARTQYNSGCTTPANPS